MNVSRTDRTDDDDDGGRRAGGDEPASAKLEVLVVDDNALNAKLLRLALESQGFAVRVADRMDEAGEAVRLRAPAIMLLDVQLHGADGLTLLRAVRSTSRIPRFPVVVVSAFAAAEDLERAYAAGADAFVPKPVNIRSLLRIVESLVPARITEPGSKVPASDIHNEP